MHVFFERLGIKEPVFIGASDGGMVAQIYTQAYPGEAGGLILISTGDMDAETIKSLRKKYFLAPLMHDPAIQYVSGGHLSTILKADDYVKVIRDFLGNI